MAGFEMVYQMLGSFVNTMKTVGVYAVPFIMMMFLLLGLFLYLRRKKLYKVNCIIDIITDGNITRVYDKGGIIKNFLGVEEFRFKNLKRSTTVPPRKFWILQSNGSYCIQFYCYSTDDFDAVKLSFNSKLPIQNNNAFKRLINPSSDIIPSEPGMKPVDMIEEYGKVDYTPIKSGSKQFLIMKAKEIAYKHKKKEENKKWMPLLIYGGVIVLLIFIVIWYFKYAGELTDKQIACLTNDEVTNLLNGVNEIQKQEPKPVEKESTFDYMNPFKSGEGG